MGEVAEVYEDWLAVEASCQSLRAFNSLPDSTSFAKGHSRRSRIEDRQHDKLTQPVRFGQGN